MDFVLKALKLGLMLGVMPALAISGVAMGQVRLADVAEGFRAPPDDSRVMMRWWWFGPAVERAELQREIRAMKAGGIGGFEIQPVYPQSLDDPARGIRNLPYLSDEFIAALRFAAEQGRAENMRVDLTLGSGWPFGGPHVPISQAASQITMIKVPVRAGEHSVPQPTVGAGEKLLAAFVATGSADAVDVKSLRPLRLPSEADVRVVVASAAAEAPRRAGVSSQLVPAAQANERVVLFFLQTRTGQQVKRPGIGGEGFVLDHLSRAAIDNHLRVVGDRLLTAFADRPPYAVFSDSLEVYHADWTDDFAQEFAQRRGYDLLQHLPALFLDTGPEAQDIRHDWGRTLSELVDERYLIPLDAWAKTKGTRLRSQTYGFPPVTLSSNALVALPEGEGHAWREFSTTRWASSANHLYGRPVTSVEAWTWLHSPSFRATPLDLKAEADTLFLQGVNQLIGHGWPYTPSKVAEPGWALYAAAVFNDHNPWWLAMPDITRYLHRVSYLLRQGEPVADVAIYLPTNDAWAATTPGHASVSDEMKRFVTESVTTQVLDAGYSFDYVDAGAIEKNGLKYRALILPHVTRMEPATYKRIADYAKSGGAVIAIGSAPSLGAGLENASVQREQVEAQSRELFGAAGLGKLIARDEALSKALRDTVAPDLQWAQSASAIGFVHRKLADGELYFVANTSPQRIQIDAAFRDQAGRAAQRWNLVTGERVEWGGARFTLNLAPYESQVWVFGTAAGAATPIDNSATERTTIADLSTSWSVKFAALGKTQRMATLRSWTDDESTRYFSGIATYSRELNVPKTARESASRLILSFGEGERVAPDSKQRGSRAWLESPIREVAEIYVNDKRAGTIWCPPYELDITDALRAGRNKIELRVGNLAVNTLAGRAPPDYRLLNLRYGERFTPQDMENLQPLPAGVLGPVTLQAIAQPAPVKRAAPTKR
jgi:hypothetical protein